MGPQARRGGMQLAAEQHLPPKSCRNHVGHATAQPQDPAPSPTLPIPISGTPQPCKPSRCPAHPPPAPELPGSLRPPSPPRHPKYLRPLPATLNTCSGERRLPQGAFHSGKSHPPHGGSCFRGIPTRAKPHGTLRGKLRQGGAARSVYSSAGEQGDSTLRGDPAGGPHPTQGGGWGILRQSRVAKALTCLGTGPGKGHTPAGQ